MACYFRQFARDRCHGTIDHCHIVSQQRLKWQHSRANPRVKSAWDKPTALTGTKLADLLADERNIVLGCRYHHANADLGWLDYDPPDSAREFAAEYGLERLLPEA